MGRLGRDLLYALRSLRRQPGFTTVVVLTLALGIGANTAVFSVVNGVILRPLGYPAPERLMFITSQFPGLGFDQFWVSIPEYLEFREHNGAFESVGAYAVGSVSLGTDPPLRSVRAVITADLMPVLGVRPAAGRWFEAADEAPGAEPVTILSWELWQRAFGADPGTVGRTTMIDGVWTRVVGIMPPGFDVHDQKVEIWEPLTIDPQALPGRRGNHLLYLIGRLAPGVSRGAARADLDRLLVRWREIQPTGHVPSPDTHRLRIDPLKDDIIGPVRSALVTLQGAVLFVLLIACANLANLLIARADSRLREYAVRTALGASRGRLFRQLMTEGLVLAVAAAVVGTVLASGGLSLLLSVNPDALPRTADITLDLRVLGFTVVLAGATAVIFGLVPLARVSSGGLGQALRDATGRSTAGARRARLRGALVVAEVALAVLLVVGSGLLIRSFVNLMQVDVGFRRAQLSTFGIALPPASYSPQARADFYQDLTERVQALPGVQSVAAMTGLPPLRRVDANDTDFEHIPNDRPRGEEPIENVDFYQQVTVGYPETMGIPVVDGRTFEDGDVVGPPVAMVNETLARKFFADRSPVGRHVKPGVGDQLPWFTIVGVLGDVRQGGVDAQAGTELYLLAPQGARLANVAPTEMHLVVRSERPLEALAPEIRGTVSDLDATLPILDMRSMDEVIGASVAQPRFLTLLLGVFAALALALAAVGTYGILSYLVAERRQEIGIRMALGADRGEILRLVLARGLLLSGAGVVLGLAASAGLTRVLASMLFEVSPTDPLTLAGVTGVISVVAVVACLAPAWRASRVSPLTVLRET